jgi:hypothetical protein
MKAIKLIGLILILAITSCKKSDLNESNENQTPELSLATATTQEWQVTNDWKASGNLHESTISNSAITEDIAANGLVLIYIKDIHGSAVLLPARIEQTNWFYQVENGLVQINAVQKDGTAFKNDQTFSFVLFSQDQLNRIAEKGITKFDLMKMDREQVKQLSK